MLTGFRKVFSQYPKEKRAPFCRAFSEKDRSPQYGHDEPFCWEHPENYFSPYGDCSAVLRGCSRQNLSSHSKKNPPNY